MTLLIIRDTREQYEPVWSDVVDGEERHALPYGDFSAVGVTDIASLELKWNLDDLAACVGRERERFDSMLRGLQRYPVRALIVAASLDDVREHRYVSAVRPNAIVASTWAWAADYGVATVWAIDPPGATKVIEWFLRRTVEKHERGEYEIDRAEKRDVIAAVREGVRLEMWHELLCSRAAPPPEHLSEVDRVHLAAHLRATADELDPPVKGPPVRTYADVLISQGRMEAT